MCFTCSMIFLLDPVVGARKFKQFQDRNHRANLNSMAPKIAKFENRKIDPKSHDSPLLPVAVNLQRFIVLVNYTPSGDNMQNETKKKAIILEPFYTGSHKVLVDLLRGIEGLEVSDDPPDVFVMTGKKWHWRARTSALHFARTVPNGYNYGCLFTSSVLPLHEFVALRPEFGAVKKVIYFHENQLVYPVRKSKDRDFQYGYNQILSCLVADVILFNSEFNKQSFLSNIVPFFKLQPDYRPKDLRESIEPKCKVLYFPLNFDQIPSAGHTGKSSSAFLRIVWPHRWEFDKNPALFFRVIMQLVKRGTTNFRLSVLGENFTDSPTEFQDAKMTLKDHIDHWGYLESKEEYYHVLRESDVVVSTAAHEFFGVAMLEAVYCGCYPLCPNALVYPDIFGDCKGTLYESESDLVNKLGAIMTDVDSFRSTIKVNLNVQFDRYDWKNLKEMFHRELYPE